MAYNSVSYAVLSTVIPISYLPKACKYVICHTHIRHTSFACTYNEHRMPYSCQYASMPPAVHTLVVRAHVIKPRCQIIITKIIIIVFFLPQPHSTVLIGLYNKLNSGLPNNLSVAGFLQMCGMTSGYRRLDGLS
jgi:hypothetical protein